MVEIEVWQLGAISGLLLILGGIIGRRIGLALGRRRGYKQGFTAGQRKAWNERAEDKRLAKLTREHTSYGHTEPRRAQGPRDFRGSGNKEWMRSRSSRMTTRQNGVR